MVMVLIVELGRDERGVLVVQPSGSAPVAYESRGESMMATGDIWAGTVEAVEMGDADDTLAPPPSASCAGDDAGPAGVVPLGGGGGEHRWPSVVDAWFDGGGSTLLGDVGCRPKKSDLALLCTDRRSGMLSSKRNWMSGNWMTRPPFARMLGDVRLSYRLSGRSAAAMVAASAAGGCAMMLVLTVMMMMLVAHRRESQVTSPKEAHLKTTLGQSQRGVETRSAGRPLVNWRAERASSDRAHV